jgi:ferredoxin-like protein FixX
MDLSHREGLLLDACLWMVTLDTHTHTHTHKQKQNKTTKTKTKQNKNLHACPAELEQQGQEVHV